MPRLCVMDRERTVGMLQAGSWVGDVARRFCVHPSTISRLRQRFHLTENTSDRPRIGQPPFTTPCDDRHIRVMHLRDRFRTATDTASEILGRAGRRISAYTVKNRLRSYLLHARRPYRGPLLTDARRQARREWVRQRIRWNVQNWSRILFTDESRFCMSHSDGRLRVWRRTGERYSDACVRHQNRWGGPSVMVWTGISSLHCTELIVCKATSMLQDTRPSYWS